MSVEDLVYNLMNPEGYMFKVDDYEYYKFSDIPANILIMMVSSWELIVYDVDDNMYTLEIYTWNYFQDQLISGLELVCFSRDQLDAMVKNGTSLSNITDMTLTMDSVKELYSSQGFTKEKVRPIIYDYYANILVEKLNKFILNREDK